MADRLEDFQKFRTDLNEEILGCGHLGIKALLSLWTTRPTNPAPSVLKRRNCSGWSLPPFCVATIASPIIWFAAARKAGSATK